ncbi:MAG: DoxX family protein [Leptospirales bacterium]|nr:DoxX family protein [Leptospirales bacterium]
MLQKLLKTDSSDYISLILRLTLGLFFFPHGMQKLFGWFGGYGFEGTYGFLTGAGLPGVVAFLVIIGESFGSLGLLTGFLTRFSAASLGVIMIGAAILMHRAIGFVSTQAGLGWELHFLAIGISIALTIRGGGMASVDGILGGKLKG